MWAEIYAEQWHETVIFLYVSIQYQGSSFEQISSELAIGFTNYKMVCFSGLIPSTLVYIYEYTYETKP